MDWGSPEFVIFIVAICTFGWVMNNWIRARHGYPLEDEWGGKTAKPQPRDDARLLEQNRQLVATLEKMQDRMVVLERIVTDRGYTVAAEIEALRDRPAGAETDTGVPLNLASKEHAQ
jgi:hypothetical protein